MTIQTYLSRIVDHRQVEEPITVTFNVLPRHRGSRDSLGGIRGAGPPLEPDEPPEIELTAVYNTETRHEVELTKKEEEQVLAECWEAVEDVV